MLRSGGAWLALASVIGCSRAPAKDALPAAQGIELAGCAAVIAGPVCEMSADDRELRVWLPAPYAVGEVTLDDHAIAASSVDVDAGKVVRFEAPRGARDLRVIAVGPGAMRASWSMRVAELPASAPSIADARRLRAEGKVDEAASLLRAAMPAMAERDRAEAAGVLGRIELSRGERDAARAALDEGATSHEAHGRASLAADDASVLARLAIDSQDLDAARAVTARIARDSADYPEGRAIHDYYEGEIARLATDPEGALRLLGASRDRAARLGLAPLRRIAIQGVALELLALGRVVESFEMLRALEAGDGAKMAPCDRADLLTNVGWTALIGRAVDAEAPAFASADPEAWFAQALARYREPCGRKWQRANVLVNIAWASVERGDLAKARAHLAEARAALAAPGATLAFALAYVEARVALAEKDPRRMREASERLTRLARTTGLPEHAWRAADLRSEALAQLGDFDGALRGSEEAEEILEDLSRSIPLGDGRDSFLGAREQSARRRVELLYSRGRVREALAAARRARGRIVAEAQRVDRIGAAPPEARAKWEEALLAYRRARDALVAESAGDWALSQLALEKAAAARKARDVELRAALERAAAIMPRADAAPARPRSGEVLLAYFPITRGWLAFAAHDDAVEAAVLARVDASAPADVLARALLEPHRARIAQAARVRVVAHGALGAVDFHALPFEGAPLFAHAPVEYALDLGGIEAASAEGAAAIVGDPSSDLPSARAEADAVASALAPRAVRLLRGRAATRAAVADAIATASFLHYAGHGAFAGRDGWESALPLANGERFTIGDILALPRVSPDVVLSGCETAKTSADADAGRRQLESLGIAQAFLAAGAAHVVAAVRKVDDADTAKLMNALYANIPKSGAPDLALALREAQVALRAASPGADVAAFRALGR